MALKQEKIILKLYNESIKNGIIVSHDETIENIVNQCKEKGQFAFYVNSYWSFVKSTFNDKKCIRMLFALKNEEEGKVHNIERVLELLRDLEQVLIFVDKASIKKENNFIYLDVIKFI